MSDFETRVTDLLAKATPGPWEWTHLMPPNKYGLVGTHYTGGQSLIVPSARPDVFPNVDDAALIAAAPALLAEAVARITELEAEVARLRDADLVDDLYAHADGNTGEGCWDLYDKWAALLPPVPHTDKEGT